MSESALHTDSVKYDSILESIQTPFGTIPPTWHRRRVMAFNIPLEMFKTTPTKWSDLGHSNDAMSGNFKIAFFMLVRMVEMINQPRLNGTTNDGAESIMERLNDKSGNRVGYRFWIFETGTSDVFPATMISFLEDNRKFKDDNRKRAAEGKSEILPANSQCYRGLLKLNDLKIVLKAYNDDIEINPDEINRDSNAVDKDDSPLNPYNAFHVKHALSLMRPGTRKTFIQKNISNDQLDMSNYFLIEDGGSVRTFKGFPKPDLVYRYYPEHFSPAKIFSAPLPDVINEKYFRYLVQLDEGLYQLQKEEEVYMDKMHQCMLKWIEHNPSQQAFETIEDSKARFTEWINGISEDEQTREEQEVIDIMTELGRIKKSINSMSEDILNAPREAKARAYQILKPRSDKSLIVVSEDALEQQYAENNNIIGLRRENLPALAEFAMKHHRYVRKFQILKEKYIHDSIRYKSKLRDLKDRFPEKDAKNKEVAEREKNKYLLEKEKLMIQFMRMNNTESLEDVIRRLEDYKQEKSKLKMEYDPRNYANEEWNLRKGMINNFWNVFMKGEKVTPVVENARRFWANTERQFYDFPQIYRNLSIFGNMITRFVRHLDIIKQVESQFQFGTLIWVATLCAGHYNCGSDASSWIKPNILPTGSPGAGKSFIMQKIISMLMAGSVLSASHITGQAFNVGGRDISDMGIYLEETPNEWLGYDKNGKKIHVDSSFKQRLSSGRSSTMAYSQKKEEGNKRDTEVIHSRTSNVHVMCSNQGTTDDAVADRAIEYRVKTQKRKWPFQPDIIISQDCDNSAILQTESDKSWQLIHFYVIVLENMITAGVIPEVDMTHAEITASLVFKYLVSKEVKQPKDRIISMYKELCRALTMFYAIEAVFNSELHVYTRIDKKTKMEKKFDPKMMIQVVPFLVVNQECSIFVMTLLEENWVRNNNTEITNILIEKLNVYPPVENLTRFLASQGQPGERGNCSHDLRYMASEEHVASDICNAISEHMPRQMSPADIQTTLQNMRSIMIWSRPKYFQTDSQYEIDCKLAEVKDLQATLEQLEAIQSQLEKKEVSLKKQVVAQKDIIQCDEVDEDDDTGDLLDMLEDDNSDEEEEGDEERPNNKPVGDDNDNCKKIQMVTKEDLDIIVKEALEDKKIEKVNEAIKHVILHRDVADNEYKTRLEKDKTKQTTLIHRLTNNPASLDPDQVVERKIFRDNPLEKPQLIPAVKMFQTSNEKKRVVAVAVDLYKPCYVGLMKEALSSLNHEFQDERTYITGMPLQRINPHSKKREILYNVFDVFQTKREPGRILTMGSKYSITEKDKNQINKWLGLEVKSGFGSAKTMVRHTEDLVFKKAWNTMNLPDNRKNKLALPQFSSTLIWKARKIKSQFKKYKTDYSEENYPDSLLKTLDECTYIPQRIDAQRRKEEERLEAEIWKNKKHKLAPDRYKGEEFTLEDAEEFEVDYDEGAPVVRDVEMRDPIEEIDGGMGGEDDGDVHELQIELRKENEITDENLIIDHNGSAFVM